MDHHGDVPDLASLDEILRRAVVGLVAEDMTDHHHTVTGRRGLLNLLRIPEGQRDRLLAQHVPSRLESTNGELGVARWRSADADHVGFQGQHLVEAGARLGAHGRGELLRLGEVGVRDRHHVDALGLRVGPDMASGDQPGTNHANPQ